MTLPHIVYIPFLLSAGFAAGWYLGSRAVRNEWARAEKRRQAEQ